MMKFGDIKTRLGAAIVAGDIPTIHGIVDPLRLRGWGPIRPFDYSDLLAFAQRAAPGLTRQAWDALLDMVDDYDRDACEAQSLHRVAPLGD